MSLKSILIKIFPILYSLANRAWFNMPKEQQMQALQAIHFTDIIKTNLDATPADVISKISQATGLSTDTVDLALSALAKIKNLPIVSAEAFIVWAQNEAKGGLSDIGWNLHWDGIAKALAVILSGNKIDWLSLMLGLLQIALEIFRKG